jgi:DNA-directed RNA polymerase subunit M/transcription elongation factor TFIIS
LLGESIFNGSRSESEGPKGVLFAPGSSVLQGDEGIFNELARICGRELGEQIYRALLEAYPELTSRLIKSRSLCLNLDSQSYLQNTKLLSRVKSGELLVSELVRAHAHQIFPERWDLEIGRLAQLNTSRAVGKRTLGYSPTLACPRCHEKKVHVHETPDRGDEGARMHYACHSCGYKWGYRT